MALTVEGVGKNYEEALSDGLKKIGLKKEEVDIELIEEPKKRFFSILDPKVVKVKITEKESKERTEKAREVDIKEYSKEEIKKFSDKAKAFLNNYFLRMGIEAEVLTEYEENMLKIEIKGEKAGLIIGYRGETLDALQTILAAVINKNEENHIKILLDIENYRKKRIKTLEELALKEANTVIAKRRSVTLEPMVPFERKVIHTVLQDHPKVKSESIGDEPYRKVVISLR
jgi:spoIIIJ-associated protein